MSNSVYQYVTDRIISELEKGRIPWRKTWKGHKAINYVTRKEYRGINLLLLPYPGEYLTFNQIKERGGNVKKGEKANMIVFYKNGLYTDDDTGEEKTYPVLRYYNVFHISQVENIDSKLDEFVTTQDNAPDESANALIDNYILREHIKLSIIKGSDRACYIPVNDEIVVPHLNQFTGSAEYYSTLFHESAHSTGAKNRLDRFSQQKTHAFGSKDYSKEELVAEITAAMLCNSVGLEIPETFENSVAYIQSWLRKLQDDVRLIVSASGQAQKATDYILGQ